ncbi:hypothetical protein GCM10023144_13510 [Pigmentiphaga soli]|uniref:Uncharacterized protein n=1 Tax=Pigmentiphaga soli TaxID=1007095 RepID=A0ABP8GPG6_9BURK
MHIHHNASHRIDQIGTDIDYNFDVLLQPYSPLLDPEPGLTRLFWSKAAKPGVPYVSARAEREAGRRAVGAEGRLAGARGQMNAAMRRRRMTALARVPGRAGQDGQSL